MLRPGIAAAASLSVSPDEQGAVAGLTSGAGASGFIFAPLIGNALYAWSPALPYWLGTALTAGLFVYALSNRRLHVAAIPQARRHLAADAPGVKPRISRRKRSKWPRSRLF